MVRRLTARQALRYLQDIEPDCSDGELSDSEDPWANDAFPCTLASDEKLIVNDSSDEDSEDDDEVIDSDDSDDEMQDFVGKDGSLSVAARACFKWGCCNRHRDLLFL